MGTNLSNHLLSASVQLSQTGVLGWVRDKTGEFMLTLLVVGGAVGAVIVLGVLAKTKSLGSTLMTALTVVIVLAAIGGGLTWAAGQFSGELS